MFAESVKSRQDGHEAKTTLRFKNVRPTRAAMLAARVAQDPHTLNGGNTCNYPE